MIEPIALGLLYLAPAVLLGLLLLGGRYPGEVLLERVVRALRPTRRRRPAVMPPPRRRAGGRASRARGAVLAWSLAGRGPPHGAPSPSH